MSEYHRFIPCAGCINIACEKESKCLRNYPVGGLTDSAIGTVKLPIGVAQQLRCFSHKEYEEIFKSTIAEMQRLGSVKGGEYAGDDDRLANFRRNAERLELPMEAVWAVYAAKHWDAVIQFVQDVIKGKTRPRAESISGRLDDLIVYAILFKCIIIERERNNGRTEATESADKRGRSSATVAGPNSFSYGEGSSS